MATKKKTEDAREQAPSVLEKMESLAALEDRFRVPAWQQAALLRFMGWTDGKMLTEAEYRAALDKLAARRLGGGRSM